MTDGEPHDETPADDEPSTDDSREDEVPDEEPTDEREAGADTFGDGDDRPDEADGTPGETDVGADDEPPRRADDVPGEGDGTPDEGADAPPDRPDRPDDLSVEPSGTLDGDEGDGSKTLGERLHEFAVDLLETGTAAGSDRGGRISYGYTARTGPRGPASPHRRRRPSRGGSSDADAPDAHASVARDDDDIRVTVDLPGVDPDDLTVGVDPEHDALVVAVEGTVLARVPLEGTNEVDDCWLNNDVLTVHLTDR